MKRVDLTGKTFGRLKVIDYAFNRGVHPMWNCECVCGNKSKVASTKLKSGSTKSCGCLRIEKAISRGSCNKKKYPKEYCIWKNMRQRCLNKKNKKYKSYGGRGIELTSKWDSFDIFLKDMGSLPLGKNSIGRIDNNKGYYKKNCRWENNYQQANNTRRNVFLIFNGKKMTVSQWERELGKPSGTVKSRLYRGWDINRALTT